MKIRILPLALIVSLLALAPTTARADDTPAASTGTAKPDKPAKPGKGGNKLEQKFDELDKNKDGKLSKEEVSGDKMLAKNFDEIDTNKDGFIDKDELKAFMEARRRQRGNGKGPKPAPDGGTNPPAQPQDPNAGK